MLKPQRLTAAHNHKPVLQPGLPFAKTARLRFRQSVNRRQVVVAMAGMEDAIEARTPQNPSQDLHNEGSVHLVEVVVDTVCHCMLRQTRVCD